MLVIGNPRLGVSIFRCPLSIVVPKWPTEKSKVDLLAWGSPSPCIQPLAVMSYLAHEGSAVLDHLNGCLFWALFEDRFLVQTKLKQTDFASASSSLRQLTREGQLCKLPVNKTE